MAVLGQSEVVRAACAIKDLDPALVIGVHLTADDIFLITEALGEIRVERSALSAMLPAHAEQPPSIVDRLLHVDESEFKVELDPDPLRPYSVAAVAVLASRPRPVCWTWKSR